MGVKNILITGASGFIGGHIAESAVKKGYHVYVLVRNSSNIELLKQNELFFIKADISDREGILNAFTQLNEENVVFDFVIHAAALTKAKGLDEFMNVNFSGTENLLAALDLLSRKPERIIFLSSLAASGPGKIGEVVTQNNQQPITNYGISKLKTESLLVNSGIPYIIIRPTAVYGPGERDLFTVFKVVNKGLNPILGFHRQQLTFIYVSDLVEIIMLSISSEKVNKIYFATDGKVYEKEALGNCIADNLDRKVINVKIPLFIVKSVAAVSQLVAGITGKLSALNLEKYRELKAESWVCDVGPTFEDLEYQPLYHLEKGVKKTSNWYKTNKWI